jgi:hypothetical protein
MFGISGMYDLHEPSNLRYGNAIPITNPLFSGPYSICAVRGYLIFLIARRNAERFLCDSLSPLYPPSERKLRVQMLYCNKLPTERLSQQSILTTALCPNDPERKTHYIDINIRQRFSECTQSRSWMHRVALDYHSEWHLFLWPCWHLLAHLMPLFLPLLYRYAMSCCNQPKQKTDIDRSSQETRVPQASRLSG